MNRSAFTLIELLVVVAIIGVISTISIVSFSSAREKARISNGLQYSQNLLTSTGDDLVGRWDFDECSGTDIHDTSSMKRDRVFSGTLGWSTDTPSGKGCSMYFNGASNVDIPYSWTLKRNSFSASGWIKTTRANAYQNIGQAGIGGGSAHLIHISNVGTARFCVRVGFGCAVGTKFIADGKWHLIVVVGDSQSIRAYIDGSSTPDIVQGPDSNTTTGTMSIGSLGGVSDFYTGYTDDIRFYDRALTAKEIETLYVETISPTFAKN